MELVILGSIIFGSISTYVQFKFVRNQVRIKIKDTDEMKYINDAFNKFKKNTNISYDVGLYHNMNKKSYSAIANILLKKYILLDKGTILAGSQNKAFVYRIMGHELAHIENKDKDYAVITKRNKAFHIVNELRCDIVGCHKIAKLSIEQMQESFDFSIQKEYKKSEEEMTDIYLKQIEKKDMEKGYPSYITRKRLTLKYNELSKDVIKDVMKIFFIHFNVENKKELIEELIQHYITERE